MATTKQAVRAPGKALRTEKATAPAPVADGAAAPPPVRTPAEETADLVQEYLVDRIYDALLEIGEAAKASEITIEINEPRITFPLVRRALGESPRFLSVDRLWNLAARYVDTSRPTERNLLEALAAAGRPLSTAQLATELSIIYNRSSDVYLGLLARIAGPTSERYVRTQRGEIVPRAWLPVVDADEEEDILFDNELTAAQLAPYREAARTLAWSPATYAEASRAVVEALGGRPVPHRVLGALARLGEGSAYDPKAHLLACLRDPGLVWLSPGRWITRARAEQLLDLLAERAALLVDEDVAEEAPARRETADGEPAAVVAVETAPAPEEPAAVAAPAPPAAPESKPLLVRDEDLAAIEKIVIDRGSAVDAAELLALQFEVVPGDPSFKADLAVLTEALRASDRFLYVGASRFREPNSLPLFVYTLPEYLLFPDLQFVSLEGEIMDEEIEDEGFAGTLRQEILDSLAQDAGDDEGRYTGDASPDAESLRLVLKAHHKEIGTFPLCQIPDGFFPTDAPVIEVTIRDPEGVAHDIIINNELRLAFNLFGLYEHVAADSGGVFHLHRTVRPYEFRFTAGEEPDGRVYLAPERMGDLLALREQAEEGGDTATFDIACEVLAHYPKGIDFVEAMTEVNIVRRVTRRRLASILSNYYCFTQKPGQNLWRFDAKKRDLGTDRNKRKYLKR